MSKVAKVEIRKANLASAGEKQEYVSSSLLNAYKQFKKIERRAENDKFKKQ